MIISLIVSPLPKNFDNHLVEFRMTTWTGVREYTCDCVYRPMYALFIFFLNSFICFLSNLCWCWWIWEFRSTIKKNALKLLSLFLCISESQTSWNLSLILGSRFLTLEDPVQTRKKRKTEKNGGRYRKAVTPEKEKVKEKDREKRKERRKRILRCVS